MGNAPEVGQIMNIKNVYVRRGSTGWNVDIPGEWKGCAIDYIDEYNLFLDGNGTVVEDDVVRVFDINGAMVGQLPVPVRVGCDFLGWFTEREGGIEIKEGMSVSEDITLYAHWSEATIPSGIPILDIEKNILVSVDLNGATAVEIPKGVVGIAANAFEDCENIECVSIPESVASIPVTTFANCDKLWANWYKSLANGSDAAGCVTLTVTNVVVHHVTASVPSTAVTPPEQTGLVNVIAEVTSGGPVAIASTWAEQYEGFAEKFGSDFTAALTMPTGKRDGAGNEMLVWQDYVAGTDPTDEEDVFRASITFDAQGKPVISHTPELSAAEAAKRTYRTFGKVKLNDKDWTEVAEGEEDDYNFFKVTVEMK